MMLPYKWALSADEVRSSFFNAFIPGINVTSSILLDDHMNPVKQLQLLRFFIHDKNTQNCINSLLAAKSIEVHLQEEVDSLLAHYPKVSQFLAELSSHFKEIKSAFPPIEFDGILDFACRLGSGEIAIVEMQVIPQDFFDRRALAYASFFYCHQLTSGFNWVNIQRVVSINILGGGKDNLVHWKDTPEQYIRNYRLQEQLHKENPPRYIDGIEIFQCALANAPEECETPEQTDWITFFRDAQDMSEEEVIQKIKTPAVLEAFNRIKIGNLPLEVLKEYEREDLGYDRFSQYTKEIKEEGIALGEAKGKEEGIALAKITMARNLLRQGVTISVVAIASDLSEDEIRSLDPH